MKSGTTTLHRLLDGCADVFLPRDEVFYFDLDDAFQHPDFLNDGNAPDFEGENERYLARYRALFADAPEGACLGEDSTSYLPSRQAAPRIRALRPDARILALLRHPTERTLSHYWHLVRTGRATLGLEETLHQAGFRGGGWDDNAKNRARPHATLLQRSLYLPQVEHWLRHFPAEQVHFEIFEEFVDDPAAGLQRVRRFLELPEATSRQPPRTRFGATRWPRSLGLRLLQNRLLGPHRAPRYDGHLGLEIRSNDGPLQRVARGVDRLISRLNDEGNAAPPAVSAGTRRMLDDFFAAETRPLGKLLGRDLTALGWPAPAGSVDPATA